MEAPQISSPERKRMRSEEKLSPEFRGGPTSMGGHYVYAMNMVKLNLNNKELVFHSDELIRKKFNLPRDQPVKGLRVIVDDLQANMDNGKVTLLLSLKLFGRIDGEDEDFSPVTAEHTIITTKALGRTYHDEYIKRVVI